MAQVRDTAAYEEAKEAAGGDHVAEINAEAVQPDMLIRHNGRWLPVQFKSAAGDSIRIDFMVAEPGSTAFVFADPSAPMYRRTPSRLAETE